MLQSRGSCAWYLAVSQQLAPTTPAGLLRCPIHPSCSPLLLSRLLLRLRLVLRGFLAAGSCHSTRFADVPAASSASRSVIASATASCCCSGASLAWRLKRCNRCRWSGLRPMRSHSFSVSHWRLLQAATSSPASWNFVTTNADWPLAGPSGSAWPSCCIHWNSSMRRHPSQMPASSHISQRAVAKGLLSGNPEDSRLFILMPPFGSSKHFLLESHWQQYSRS